MLDKALLELYRLAKRNGSATHTANPSGTALDAALTFAPGCHCPARRDFLRRPPHYDIVNLVEERCPGCGAPYPALH